MFSIIASNEAGDSPPATTMETTASMLVIYTDLIVTVSSIYVHYFLCRSLGPTLQPGWLRPPHPPVSPSPGGVSHVWRGMWRSPSTQADMDLAYQLEYLVLATECSLPLVLSQAPATHLNWRALHVNHFSRLLQIFNSPPATVTGTTAAPTGKHDLSGLIAASHAILCPSTGVGFFLNGVLYPNNSVVALADIGEAADIGGDNTALFCLTDLTACCRGMDGGSAGEWFLAGQTEPVVDASNTQSTHSFTRGRGPSAVRLNRVGMLRDPLGSTPVRYLMGVVSGQPTLEWIQVLSCDLHVIPSISFIAYIQAALGLRSLNLRMT